MELVPVEEGVGIFGVEVFGFSVDIEPDLFGVGFHHQIEADHDGVAAIPLGRIAPHLHPGVLGGLVSPHRVVEPVLVEPIAGFITDECELAAAGSGAEADDGEQIGLADHVEQPI